MLAEAGRNVGKQSGMSNKKPANPHGTQNKRLIRLHSRCRPGRATSRRFR